MPWRRESDDRFCKRNPTRNRQANDLAVFFSPMDAIMENGRSQSVRYMTDDLRIKEIKELSPPSHLIRDLLFLCRYTPKNVGCQHRECSLQRFRKAPSAHRVRR